MQVWIRYKRTRDKRVLLYMVVFLYSDREVINQWASLNDVSS